LDSLENFKKFLEGEEIDEKIKWTGTSGKNVVTYTKIFELLHLMINEGNTKLTSSKRKKMMNFIIDNFEKYENSNISEIPYDSLNGAYTNYKL